MNIHCSDPRVNYGRGIDERLIVHLSGKRKERALQQADRVHHAHIQECAECARQYGEIVERTRREFCLAELESLIEPLIDQDRRAQAMNPALNGKSEGRIWKLVNAYRKKHGSNPIRLKEFRRRMRFIRSKLFPSPFQEN